MVTPINIRTLLALLVMASVIGIAIAVLRSGTNDSGSERVVRQPLPQNIDVTLKKARFSEIINGQTVWELVAERVDYNKGGDIAYLSDIRMEFKHTRTHGMVTVTADKGEYSSTKKSVRLNGNVHGVTEDGASFKTGRIVYTGATDQLTTVDVVVYQQQRLQLTATGMNMGVNNQQARFLSSVTASINSR